MLLRRALQEKQMTIALFMLPAILLVGIFMFYPAIYGFYLSFTNWNGVTTSYKFIGFRNFIEMFQDDIFYLALKNTAIYCVATILFQHLISLSLAVFLHRGLKGSKLYKSIFFIPSLLSTAVVAVVFTVIFNPVSGGLNELLQYIGLSALAQDWLGNPKIALYSIIFTNVWQYFGYSMVIYIAGLNTIPKDLEEAAVIDGANGWQKFLFIDFPSIAPAFTINTVLSMIGSLKAFENVYAMTGGGPINSTEVIATYLYDFGITANRLGYGSAVSLVMFILIVIISIMQTKLLRAREVEL